MKISWQERLWVGEENIYCSTGAGRKKHLIKIGREEQKKI